jgi:tRNA(fMet)-specific endonuclease VapC
VRYVLDTDTCIWLLEERGPVLSRVRATAPDDLAVTTMTEAELRYSARDSRDPAAVLARVEAFLSAPIERLPFDSDAARWYAEVRWALRSRPVGERDLVIASVALAQQATLVTCNRSAFDRVPGLVLEDWSLA